jgi:hypothetical protein
VVVAVLDESIQIAHPDLAANVWKNPGEVAGDGIDNDANGYVDDVNGWDFYYKTTPSMTRVRMPTAPTWQAPSAPSAATEPA